MSSVDTPRLHPQPGSGSVTICESGLCELQAPGMLETAEATVARGVVRLVPNLLPSHDHSATTKGAIEDVNLLCC